MGCGHLYECVEGGDSKLTSFNRSMWYGVSYMGGKEVINGIMGSCYIGTTSPCGLTDGHDVCGRIII